MQLMAILRGVRRRLNQALGRDLPFRSQVRVPRLFLGSEYGGWMVHPELLNAESVVFSVGVGNDITFDRAMIERFGCVLHAFDPTPRCLEWIASQSLPHQFHFHPLGLANYDGIARFSLPPSNVVSFKMNAGQGQSEVECPVRRLSTLMSDVQVSRIDLLKIDIEGAEYDIIDDVLRLNPLPRQLLVEFHHVVGDQPSLKRTRDAVEAINRAGYRIFCISPVGNEYSFVLP